MTRVKCMNIMEILIKCQICNDPSVLFKCKKHEVFMCGSHLGDHVSSNDLCEIQKTPLKEFCQELKLELTRRLSLIISIKRSILHTTNMLISEIEQQSNSALEKLNSHYQLYKSILNQDPNTLDSSQIDALISSVMVKLPKSSPVLQLNNYYTEDFFIEKPKSAVDSSLLETLEYLANTWDLVIQGHTNQVLSIVFDKNNTLYTGSLDQTIKIWDWPSKNYKKTLTGHKSGVTCMALNNASDKLVSGSSDTTIRVWCLESFKELEVLEEHSKVVLNLCFTADGNTLVSCSADNRIVLWNFNTMKILNIVGEHQNWVLSVAASSDNNFLASGSRDNLIKVWKLRPFSLFFTMKEHTDDVVSVIFSLDSQYLFSGSKDKTIKIWSTANFCLLINITDHNRAIKCLSVSPNYFYSISEDRILKIWNLKTLIIKSTISLQKKKVNCLAVTKDENIAAIGFEDEISLWLQNFEEKTELNSHFSKIQKVLIYDNYQLAASYASDGLKLWEISQKTLKKSCRTFEEVIIEVNKNKSLGEFLEYFA